MKMNYLKSSFSVDYLNMFTYCLISLWILLIYFTTMCNLMCSKILYSNLYDWYCHWGSMSLTSVCHILQPIFFWCAFCKPLPLYVVYVRPFKMWTIKRQSWCSLVRGRPANIVPAAWHHRVLWPTPLYFQVSWGSSPVHSNKGNRCYSSLQFETNSSQERKGAVCCWKVRPHFQRCSALPSKACVLRKPR